jgi:hypothetical protein
MPRSAIYISLAVSFCMLASLTRAADPNAQRVVVVSEQDLPTRWRLVVAGKDLELLTLQGGKMRYGCINVGYLIESDGKVAQAARLLSYRADRNVPSRDYTFDLLANLVQKVIPNYAPAREDLAPVATYTSRSIPVLNDKTQQTLNPEQQVALKSALRQACTITDLHARLSDGQKKAVQLEPLPPLEMLIGNP